MSPEGPLPCFCLLLKLGLLSGVEIFWVFPSPNRSKRLFLWEFLSSVTHLFWQKGILALYLSLAITALPFSASGAGESAWAWVLTPLYLGNWDHGGPRLQDSYLVWFVSQLLPSSEPSFSSQPLSTCHFSSWSVCLSYSRTEAVGLWRGCAVPLRIMVLSNTRFCLPWTD